MKHFSGYGSYLLFISLKAHFHSNYDFFKYNGKLLASRDSYNERNDKSFFERLARRYNSEELKEFYIANILDDRCFITDMLDDKAHETYFKHVGWRQAFQYNLRNELEKLFEDGVAEPFKVSKDEYPPIIISFLRREVSIGALVILDDYINFSEKFSKYLDGDILWNKVSIKIQKYKPFLKYNKTQVDKILKGVINDYTTSRDSLRHYEGLR